MSMKKKKRELNSWLVTLGAIAVILVVGFLAWLQLDTYEHGILDVYAVQQDGYVQLVLDQINLIDDETDEVIVNDILATLDASSNKYWTLSKDDALVFIKDVQETNRYKGFTTATYFVSDSADEFISGLQVNRVVHRTIDLNDIPYIASGVKFEYGGEKYGICLLTASSFVLDHNAYLSAKINLFILFVIILAIFIVGGLTLAVIAQNRYNKLNQSYEDNKQLREQIERLTELFTRQELYNTRYMAFGEPAVEMLINKLEGRDIWPLTYMIVKCSSEEQRNQFMLDTQALCGVRFIRALAKNNYLLIFNVHSEDGAVSVVRNTAVHSGAEVVGNIVFPVKPDIPLSEAITQYNSVIMIDESGKNLFDSHDKLRESLGINETPDATIRKAEAASDPSDNVGNHKAAGNAQV